MDIKYARNTKWSNNAILAYTALCILKADKTFNSEIVTVRGACFALTQNSNINRAFLENMRAGLNEINDNCNLEVVPFKCDFMVNWKSFYYKSDFAFSVPVFAIQKIINGKVSVDKCNMLRHFLVLASTFETVNSRGLTAKMGEVSLCELSRMRRLSIKEIQKLNYKLEQRGLICYYNRYLIFGIDTTKRDLYGYGWERDQLEEYAKRKYQDQYVPVKDKDKKKKLVQMYNAVAKGYSYDRDTMIYLYSYIKKQNEYHLSIYYAEDKYKWSIRRAHKAKVKSLKPFTRYPYIYKAKEESDNRT